MNLRLDVYFHLADSEVISRLDELKALSRTIIKAEEEMAGELDVLKAEVTEIGDVVTSAIALIQGLKAALDAAIASGDPAALTALSVELDAKANALAAAITANTPTP